MANLIQPSRWHLLNVSAFIILVGSYSPGPLITGRFLYLEFVFRMDKNTLYIPSKVSNNNNFSHLNTWYAMSGMFRSSENHSPDSKNRILKNKCSKYSGITSCKRIEIPNYIWGFVFFFTLLHNIRIVWTNRFIPILYRCIRRNFFIWE